MGDTTAVDRPGWRFGMSRLFVVLGVVLVALVACAVGGSGSAFAAEAWWGLDSGGRPTVIPAQAKTAAQEITVTPNPIVPELASASLEIEGHLVACLAGAQAKADIGILPFCSPFIPVSDVDVDAAELQATLDAYYGSSDIRVSGSAGGAGVIGSGESLVVRAAGRGLAPIGIFSQGGFTVTAAVHTLSEGGNGKIVLQAVNLGDTPIEGSVTPIVLSDKLPAGLVADGLAGVAAPELFPEEGPATLVHEGTETKIQLVCSVATVSCTYTGTLLPYERLEVVVWVTRTGSGRGSKEDEIEENEIAVSGGGTSGKSQKMPVLVGEQPAGFGVESMSVIPEEEGGTSFTQAGGHPFQLTTMLRLNESGEPPFQPIKTAGDPTAQWQPRNVTLELPAGFVGNAQAVPKCSFAAFSHREGKHNGCPAVSTVGVASAGVVNTYPPDDGYLAATVPIFNLTPGAGEPARFGFYVDNVVVVLNTHVRAGGDYGVTTEVRGLTQAAASLSSVVTLWGVPGNPVHDRSRGWGCFPIVGTPEQQGCGPTIESEKPLLTLPSSCSAPFQSSMNVQAWDSTEIMEGYESSYAGAIDGCGREGFAPELAVQSSSHTAYTPTELAAHLRVPQQTSETANGVSEADVRNTKVTLPAGLQLNAAAAGGLAGCSETEIGYTKTEGEELQFKEESEAERDGEAGKLLFGNHEYGCTEASKVGLVKIKSPLLEEELTGAVYQAAQGANPFGSLLALYIIAEAPKTGVRVRLAGKVEVQPGGQIVSTFDHTPQLPFEEFELKFFGGGRAPLATTGCGAYTTSSVIESWANGVPVAPLSSFQVTGGCGAQGFAPKFVAGTTNSAGGAFGSFVMTLNREDGEQALSTVALTMPKGLIGMLAKVTPCHEAQANEGTCGAASKIGYVRVGAGIGDEPVVLPEAGKPEDPVYLTGPYDGAPFGLSIVAPAEAGPFNLDENNRPVIVRAKIEVNPYTSQVTIKSNPMPTELQNIPLNVKSVEVVINKPEFIVNPTNCKASSVTGTIGSSAGASAPVSSHFEATDCATLHFKPQFQVYTHANHTRRKGAYLQVVVKSGKGQANIGKVHVTLPKDLPTREETLKFACSEKQFASNPAKCPAGSIVGTGKATTPVLPVPLSGPAIFVSHGGAEFPNLDVVLQGDGVTVYLVGDTSIKKGITTSTFNSLPDVPVERFALTLPEGKYSALSGEGNLCKAKPKMPMTITGQNGAVIQQTTKITVTGCKAKGKAKKRSQRKTKSKKP